MVNSLSFGKFKSNFDLKISLSVCNIYTLCQDVTVQMRAYAGVCACVSIEILTANQAEKTLFDREVQTNIVYLKCVSAINKEFLFLFADF